MVPVTTKQYSNTHKYSILNYKYYIPKLCVRSHRHVTKHQELVWSSSTT